MRSSAILPFPAQGLNDLQLWGLHNRVINHLVNTLQRSGSLDHGDLSLSHDRNIIWILRDLRLEDRGIQCHGQTDRMGHGQVFLCDLGGFRISDTGIFADFALCLACKIGKVTVLVTFHLVVKHVRFISVRRWDEFLVHKCKVAITDLLEFTLHFRDVLARV